MMIFFLLKLFQHGILSLHLSSCLHYQSFKNCLHTSCPYYFNNITCFLSQENIPQQNLSQCLMFFCIIFILLTDKQNTKNYSAQQNNIFCICTLGVIFCFTSSMPLLSKLQNVCPVASLVNYIKIRSVNDNQEMLLHTCYNQFAH